jgi:hypothetical protein
MVQRFFTVSTVLALLCLSGTVAQSPGSGERILAYGPIQIKVKRADNQEKTLWLHQLTDSRLFWRNQPHSPVNEERVRKGAPKRIESMDGKYVWKLDESTRRYTGPNLPAPIRKPLVLDTLPPTPDTLDKFAIMSLTWFQWQVPYQLGKSDDLMVQALKEQAKARRDFVRENSKNEDIKAAWDRMVKLIDELTEAAAKRRRIQSDFKQELQANLRQHVELKEKQGIKNLPLAYRHRIGQLQVLLGSQINRRVYVNRYGYFHVVDSLRSPLMIVHGYINMARAEIGMKKVELESEDQRQQIREALKEEKDKFRSAYFDAEQAEDKALRELRSLSGELLSKFGSGANMADDNAEGRTPAVVAKLDLPDAKNILQTKIDQKRKENEQYKHILGVSNPYLEAEIVSLQATQVMMDRRAAADLDSSKYDILPFIKRLTELAQANLEAAKLPDHPNFNPDRAALLREAAKLQLQAAGMEIGMNPWITAFNYKAEDALTWLDAAHKQHPKDSTGTVRELRAWTLLQTGRFAEGLEEALKIKGERKENPWYFFNLARAYHLNNRSDDAIKALREAVNMGFSAIGLITLCPDLPKNKYGPEIKDMTELKFRIDIIESTADKLLAIRNDSGFTATDVNVTWEVRLEGKPNLTTKTVKGQVASIKPGETYLLRTDDPKPMRILPVYEKITRTVYDKKRVAVLGEGGKVVGYEDKLFPRLVVENGNLLYRTWDSVITLDCPQAPSKKVFKDVRAPDLEDLNKVKNTSGKKKK